MVKPKQMLNSPKLHINKKYHPPLDTVLSVTQKPWGRVWVKFLDPKTNRPQIAIAKTSMSNLLMVINNWRVMAGKEPILGIYEK